jgi:hypothetical protein
MCAVEGADRLFKAMSWIPLDGRQRFVPLYSADGLTWKPPRDLNEEFGILGPGVGDTGAACKSCDTFPLDDPNLPGKYLAFPRLHARVGRFGRRAVGYCYSTARPGQPPCVEWSQPVLAVAPDFRDDEMAEERLAAAGNTIQFSYPEDHHTEFYSMLAFRYEELFLGLLWVFDVSMNMDRLGAWNQHGIISTQLTSSRDLVHWERLGDRQPIIPLGRPGEWDCGMNHFCSYPVPCGDELRIYYAGQSQPHPMQDQARARQVAEEIRTGQRPAGITFGSLRRDGFLSLDAGEAEGFVLTKPLTITGGELHLNVRAAEGGQVVAALCDEKGYPLPGLAASRPVTGDQVDAVVVWEGGCLEALSGQCACLRLTARQAELYAFWFD